MAIIVEEEKNKKNSTGLLGWFVIIIALAAAAYYLFIVSPAPAIVTPPAGFGDITPIAELQFNPQTVVSSTAFTSLANTVSEPTSTGPAPIGRPNPFIAP